MPSKKAKGPKPLVTQRRSGIFTERVYRADLTNLGRTNRLQRRAELLGPDGALSAGQRAIVRSLRREGFLRIRGSIPAQGLPSRWYSIERNTAAFSDAAGPERSALVELVAAFIAVNGARQQFQRLLEGTGVGQVALQRGLARDAWDAGLRFARYQAYRTSEVEGKMRSLAALPRRKSMLTRRQVEQTVRASLTFAEAAATLGITERHLRDLRKRYGLD